MKKYLLIISIFFIFIFIEPALAGDGATIILKNGVTLRLTNGYSQLEKGMQELTAKGAMNYQIEIKIEGTSMFINLVEVALLCRDNCNSVRIELPQKR